MIPAEMRAAVWHTPGPARVVLRIESRPVPQPQAGEVLVRIAASGINPHDVKRRSGWMPVPPPVEPVIPHSDGSGVIAAVGEGVPASRIGERVWLFGAGRTRPGTGGTAAEFCALSQERAVPLAESVSLTEAAGLGVPCLTAHAALFMDGPLPEGATVLVHAGAGAVGNAAVRMAVRAGATVIATASTLEKLSIAREAGAQHVLDYRDPGAADEIMRLSGGKGVARIVEVDFSANQALDGAVVARHGVIASYSSTQNPKPVLDYYAFALKGVTLHFVQGMLLAGGVLERAIAATDAGTAQGWLRPRLAAALPLDAIAEAHQMVEAGAPGKVVVRVDPALA